MLNKALLAAHYDIEYWDIPDTYLCPPIPGRADYVHRAAELLDGEVKANTRTIKCERLMLVLEQTVFTQL